MGDGGLRYLGDDIEEYRRRYSLKSEENEDAWKALINLCRTINETPVEELDTALEPLVDVDNLLWFLALDASLINNDGYWVRASDYSIYLAENGKFKFVPHDMNEAFNGAMLVPVWRTRRPWWFSGGGFPGGQVEVFQAVTGGGPVVLREISPQLASWVWRTRFRWSRIRRSGFGGPGGFPGGGTNVELDPLVGRTMRANHFAVESWRTKN